VSQLDKRGVHCADFDHSFVFAAILLPWFTSIRWLYRGVACLVPSVGVCIAGTAVWYNTSHKRWGQSFCWTIILGSWILDLTVSALNTWHNEFVFYFPKFVWVWVVLNWVSARKSYSWSVYRSYTLTSVVFSSSRRMHR
jgi:hypothetical protein